MKRICIILLCLGIFSGCANKNELENLFADDGKWIPINQVGAKQQ